MKTTILYVAGWGRSGSTILSNTLNQIPGYLNVGELNYAWEKVFLEEHACGCGQPVAACTVWGPVFDAVYGGVDRVPVRDLIAMRSSLPTNLDIALGRPSKHPDTVQAYADALAAVYEAAARVTGSNVIVETSKTPSHLNLLLHASNLDVRVIHLVRDPRATANSWMRKKKRVDVQSGEEAFMYTLHPAENCRRFVACNLTLERLFARTPVPVVRLRYEDFCRSPASVLEDVVRSLDLPFPAQPFISENEIQLGVNHTIWGNPGRASTGTSKIREDTRWMQSLSRAHRVLVTVLTLPFLRRYGYPVRPPSPRRLAPTVA